MKKILSILLVLIAFIANAQDPSPLPSITVNKLIAPNNPVFYYNTLDSVMWVFKGETGWYRFASLRDIKNNKVTGISFSGTTTKQLSLTQTYGGTKTATFTDSDNQTLSTSASGTTRTLTISGGNSVSIDVADNDNSTTNEIQAPTRVADVIGLTQTTTTISISDKEDKSNKENATVDNNTTKYPTVSLLKTYADGKVSDAAYSGSWDRVTTIAPSKNSVYDKISTLESINYCATTMTVTYGTLNQGTVADLCAVGGTDVIVQERVATPPFQIDFTFSGVQRISGLKFYGRYNGSPTHNVHVEAYNYITATFDYVGEFGTTTNKQWFAYNLNIPNNYLSDGNVQVRIIHQDTGNNTHQLILDYINVNYGGGGGSGFITAGAVEFTPNGNIAATNVQAAIQELDSEKEPVLTKGNLTESIIGLQFDNIRQVIGGAADLSISSGYMIPSTASATDWDGKDPSVTNELNTSLSFNSGTKVLSITDAGGTKTTTISITGANMVNAFTNTLPIIGSTTTVTFPTAMTYENYRPILRVWYNKIINGYNNEVINPVHDFIKTVNGFSFKVDTIAGYFFYLAVDTTNIYPITVDNFVAVADSVNGYVTPYKLSSYGYLTTEVDGSITNEIQTMSSSSSGTTRTITISSGNSIGFDVSDNDNSPTNEIQDLSGSGATLSGYQISLSSDVSPVTLPNEGDGSTINEIQSPTITGNLIGLTQTTTTIDISQSTAVLANTAKATNATHTGDVTGTTTLTITTVNSNIGTYNNVTINAKGQATAGSNVTYLQNIVEDTTPQLGGDLELNSKSILYNSSFASNSTWSGETITGTAGENLVIGDFVYYKFSDGKYWKAKADAYTTARCTGITTASISANASGTILIRGTMRYDTWNWTAAEIWLSAATGGAGTSTQPSTTGNQIQYLGLALTADVIFFKPSNDIGEK